MKNKYVVIGLLLSLLVPYSHAQLMGGFGKMMTKIPRVALRTPKLVRIPVVTGAPVPAPIPAATLSRPVGQVSPHLKPVANVSTQLERQAAYSLLANQHPLITNSALIQEAISHADSQKVAQAQAALSGIWNDLLKSSLWNFRKHAELSLWNKKMSFDVQDTMLDVLTLEQYILHTGQWPRNMKDPAEAALSKQAAAALRTNYKDYVVALRKRATNIPSVAETIKQAEKFIVLHQRVPGVVYLQADNVEEGLPKLTGLSGGIMGSVHGLAAPQVTMEYVTPEERLLGADLQFLVETDIAAEQENASLARLRDWWNCYADITFVSGIPEVSAEGKANIPVLSTAQWQHKLDRWVYNQPVMALLHPARRYQQILQANHYDATTAPFDSWPAMEKDEALLNAVQYVRTVRIPQLTSAEWDERAQKWIEARGVLYRNTKIDAPFDQLTPRYQMAAIMEAIYFDHIYPQEFVKTLKEKGQFQLQPEFEE